MAAKKQGQSIVVDLEEKFAAENMTMGAADPIEQAGPSFEECEDEYRRKKTDLIKAYREADEEYKNAPKKTPLQKMRAEQRLDARKKALNIRGGNIDAAYQRCLRAPKPKFHTPLR